MRSDGFEGGSGAVGAPAPERTFTVAPDTTANGYRRKTPAETIKAAGRLIRSQPKRAAAGECDITDLALLVELRSLLEGSIAAMTQGLHDHEGYSWTELGRVLGVDRSQALRIGRKAITEVRTSEKLETVR